VQDSLQFIKDHTNNKVYTCQGKELSNSMEEAIRMIEDNKLEGALREEVINLWEEIESKFETERKPKTR
jgi:hypothetical protein